MIQSQVGNPRSDIRNEKDQIKSKTRRIKIYAEINDIEKTKIIQ